MVVSMSMVRNCTVKVLVPDSLTYVLCGIGVLITLVAVLSNITMLMFISDTRVKKQSMFFFKLITVTFTTMASVGLPMEIANIVLKTTSLQVDLCSNFMLFLSSSTLHHCISCHMLEKYLLIFGVNIFSKKKKKCVLTLLMAFVIISVNVPIFYNIYMIINQRHKCKPPPSATITIVSMVIYVTYCSLIVVILTKKAISLAKKYDQNRWVKFGKNQYTDVKRIKVIRKIWIVFSAIWLPYALVNVTKNLLHIKTYEMLNAIARMIAFVSYTALPFVYYVMDRKYAEYILQLKPFKRGTTITQIVTLSKKVVPIDRQNNLKHVWRCENQSTIGLVTVGQSLSVSFVEGANKTKKIQNKTFFFSNTTNHDGVNNNKVGECSMEVHNLDD